MLNRFIDNNDGTITDTRTNLMWEKASITSLVTWEEAASYCHKLNLGGHVDWRLPEIWELVSIADFSKCDYSGSTSIIYNVFQGRLATYYWTEQSTTMGLDGVWVFDFGLGMLDYGNPLSKLHVRAVRDI